MNKSEFEMRINCQPHLSLHLNLLVILPNGQLVVDSQKLSRLK